METFVDIISDIGAQISKIKRCRVNQQTLIRYAIIRLNFLESIDFMVFMSYSVPNLNSLQIQCNYLLHNFFRGIFLELYL